MKSFRLPNTLTSDVVEDYRVLETQVTLGKEAGSKRKDLLLLKKEKIKRNFILQHENKYV